MLRDLVDFHCHLDLYPDHVSAFAECEREGIHTLAVTTTPRAWPHNRDLAARTGYVRAALGLHPQLVSEHSAEVELWERYLPQARYVGEVGLDGGGLYYKSLDLQKQIFERILKRCAHVGGKILTVHSLRAVPAVLDMIENYLPAAHGRVVLHWFTGSRADALRAVDLGCYFSVNAEMLLSDRHRALVAALPLARLLTETDGPFTQLNGRPRCPRDAATVVEMLARVRNTDPTTIAAIVVSNLRHLES